MTRMYPNGIFKTWYFIQAYLFFRRDNKGLPDAYSFLNEFICNHDFNVGISVPAS